MGELHFTIRRNFNISYYLLKNGANPNIQDSDGNTHFTCGICHAGTAGAVPLAENLALTLH